MLTTLSLWRNKIGVEGAKAIAEALRGNGVLTSLSVDTYDDIGPTATAFINKVLERRSRSHTWNAARRATPFPVGVPRGPRRREQPRQRCRLNFGHSSLLATARPPTRGHAALLTGSLPRHVCGVN